MKKKFISSLFVVVSAFILVIALKPILFPSVEGEKEIAIQFVIVEENENLVIFDEIIRTDALTLGELLDEVNDDFNQEITYAGEKSDQFGRYIVGIGDYTTEDSAVGPWWLIDSKSNQDCLDAGFCNGIDLQSVYDQDSFELKFTSSFE